MENWKDVSEFPDLFMVSDLGRVWSKRTKKILTPTKSKSGYLTICTKVGGRKGKNISRRIHRWVCIEFLENEEGLEFVNHIDGDKTNNKLINLEWCDSSSNMYHSYDKGLRSQSRGEGSSKSVLTQSQVDWARRVHIPRDPDFSTSSLAKELGISRQHMSRIISYKNWDI